MEIIFAGDHGLPLTHVQVSPAAPADEHKTYCFMLMGRVSIREGISPDFDKRTDVFAWPGRDGRVQVPCPTDPANRCGTCVVDCNSTERVLCGDELVVAEGNFDSTKAEVPRVGSHIVQAEAFGRVIELTGFTD